MIALVRNCAHGSEVVTCRVEDDRGRRFRKSALTPDGRAALESEIAGWAWYKSRRCPDRAPICRVLRRDAHVVRIEIDEIAGTPGKAADGVSGNETLLADTIEQYRALWPRTGDLAPMHGDLSCDNLIAAPDGPIIIDWEHFHPAAAPWGFDAVYLLAESIYFQTLTRGPLDAAAYRVIARLLDRLAESGLDDQLRTKPCATVRRFIRAHTSLWRQEIERHPLKLPVLAWTDEQADAIDTALAGAADAR